jgi:predicted nucleic acid-binding protein
MQDILVDTDVAIDFLRGKKDTKKFMHDLWTKQLANLSILSTYELYAGMHPNEKEVTEAFIGGCNLVSLSMKICQIGAELYQHYRKQGITLTTVDCLIFASAKIHNYKIATRNHKHYPDKDLLKVIV